MISKNRYKYFSSLLRKKIRDEERKFIAEGLKTVTEGLDSGFSCDSVLVTEEFESNVKFPSKYNVNIETVAREDFNKLSDTITPQGVAAIFNYPKSGNPEKISSKPNCLP